MEYEEIERCIAAWQACGDACDTCSTQNNGKAGMENSVKLCIACEDACINLIKARKIGATNLDALYKKCEDACIACATECAKHTDRNYCKICADACNKCVTEFAAMLARAA